MRQKIISILSVLCLVFSGFVIIGMIPENNLVSDASAETWTDTSDVDFSGGTLENVEVIGTGDCATLQLKTENELGIWHQRNLKPTGRRGHAMAYDSANNKIVLFGGWDIPNNDETWVYDIASDAWTMMNPTTKPSERAGHAMIYDSRNKKIILFGGQDSYGRFNDTWVYDVFSNTWTQKNPSTKPSARSYHTMAYDSMNNKVMLFGGYDGIVDDETWVYDLASDTWTQKNPITKPIARSNHAMAYDSANNKIVLFGGYTSISPYYNDETWMYDQTSDTWMQMSPTTKPSGRRYHDMAYDSTNNKVVLFGGNDSTSDNGTWVYDLASDTWTQKSQNIKPSARDLHAMTYDSTNNKILVFGGLVGTNNNDETWVYDITLNSWTQKSQNIRPSERRSHAMAYDSVNNKVVLFGGDDGSLDNETWVYEVASDTWTQKNPSTKPSAREYHTMAYDSANNKIVLFGGDDGSLDDETWVYDVASDTWTQMNPSTKPSARRDHTMAYDSANNKIVLFGGDDGSLDDETWVYDVASDIWTQMSPSIKPSARFSSSMVYDSKNKKMVLFGGADGTYDDETWNYDLALDTWTQKSPSIKPSARFSSAMTYDTLNNKIILFSGRDSGGLVDDTWTYDYASDNWSYKNPKIKPNGRRIHAMVYDTTNNKVVLFGGNVGSPNEDDTWIFNLNAYYNTGTYISGTYTSNNYKWHRITWRTNTNPDGFIRFQVAVNDDGKTWNYIGPDGTSLTYYDETTEGNLFSGYNGKYLRYKAYFTTPYAGNTPELFEVSITSIPEAPTVKLTSPMGGEEWLINTYHPITWSEIDQLEDNSINLYYSINNGDTWTLIASNETNDGVYNWFLPAVVTSNAMIRVDAMDDYGDIVTDISDSSFSIMLNTPPPSSDQPANTYVDIEIENNPNTWTQTMDEDFETGELEDVEIIGNGIGANLQLKTKNELGVWHQQNQKPIARKDHALAYDSTNTKVVLFGGWDGNLDNETWIYDVSSDIWTQMNPSSKPSARWKHKMVYDSVNNKIILFGGADIFGYNDETWVYDVASDTWTQKNPTNKPSARSSHAMAYDSTNNKVVMFGGSNGTYNDDTWAYDLATDTWSKMNPTTNPSARYSHSMAYDSTNKRMVMFGGFDGFIDGETWTYDFLSDTWTQKYPVQYPSARNRYAMVFDSFSNRIVLHAGFTFSSHSDTWVYDVTSNTWTQKNPTIKPSARLEHAMAYDSANNKIVLFGGNDGSYDDETWLYDSTSDVWTQKSLTIKPSGRDSHAMAYDSENNKIILFGGYDDSVGRNNETWGYDLGLNNWTQKSPSTNPSARRHHAMVYDSANNKVVLFGGDDGTRDDETWLYDLESDTWTQMNPSPKPSARYSHKMVYDSINNKVVLFGGNDIGQDDETWLYDVSTNIWTQKNPITKPSARQRHEMVYDSANNKIVLFGGDDGTFDDETWIYDVATNIWVQKYPTINPPARTYHSMAYDTFNNKVVLFSGGSIGIYDDLWIYDLSSDTWTQKNPSNRPSPRIAHAMVYNSANGKFVLFGGNDGSRDNETWVFNLNDYHNAGTYTSGTYSSDILKWERITWRTNTDPDGSVRFQVAVNDDGTTWNFVGPDGTSLTYYDDVTGGNLYTGYNGKYLRYKAYFTTPYAGNTPKLHDVSISFLRDFPPKEPTVKLTSPNGGEDWMRGKHYPITWEAEGDFNDTPANLFFSWDNGANWSFIEVLYPNYGFYNWTVPDIETASALIAVTVIDIYGNEAGDLSDASFAIDPPPQKYVPPGGNDGGGSEVPRDEEPGAEVDEPTDESGKSKAPVGFDPGITAGIILLVIILAISIIFNLIFATKRKKNNKNNSKNKANKNKPEKSNQHHKVQQVTGVNKHLRESGAVNKNHRYKR